MESDEKIIAIAANFNLVVNMLARRRRRRRNRLICTRNRLLRRNEHGAHTPLLRELRDEDPRALKNFPRMDLNSFTELAHLVCPEIEKQVTQMREPIAAEEMLAVTLRFLASGNSYQDLEYLYRISRPSLCSLIPETCIAIEGALVNEYVKAHTILLIQPGANPETRTFSDYESINECMEGVCKIYEEHLKRQNPNTPSITYDISQLFDFVDQLADLSCLVYQKSTNSYAPYNKDWIKEKIYVLLRRQAARAS